MSDKKEDLSFHAGHRERLRQNFLDDKLAKYETLELLLSYAIPRRDVRPLARMLYNKFGGMYPILSASIDDLCAIRGMGRNTAIFIKVVQKILLDGYECKFKDSPILHDYEQLVNFLLFCPCSPHMYCPFSSRLMTSLKCCLDLFHWSLVKMSSMQASNSAPLGPQ